MTIKIPEIFRKKKIEIILLPYPERESKDRPTDKLVQFDQLVENAKSRNLKIDSDIDIDAIHSNVDYKIITKILNPQLRVPNFTFQAKSL